MKLEIDYHSPLAQAIAAATTAEGQVCRTFVTVESANAEWSMSAAARFEVDSWEVTERGTGKADQKLIMTCELTDIEARVQELRRLASGDAGSS